MENEFEVFYHVENILATQSRWRQRCLQNNNLLSKHSMSSCSVFCTQAAIEMFLYILDIEDGLKGFERVQTNWSWNKSNNASFDKR